MLHEAQDTRDQCLKIMERTFHALHAYGEKYGNSPFELNLMKDIAPHIGWRADLSGPVSRVAPSQGDASSTTGSTTPDAGGECDGFSFTAKELEPDFQPKIDEITRKLTKQVQGE